MKKEILKYVRRDPPYFGSAEAVVFIRNGIRFGRWTNTAETGLEFIHIESGTGFNGNSEGLKKSFDAVVERIGDAKFWKFINKAPTLTEYIKNRKAVEKKGIKKTRMFHQVRKSFLRHGIKIQHSRDMLMLNQCLAIDILALEDSLKQEGYNPDGTSIQQFIEEKYGKGLAYMVSEGL